MIIIDNVEYKANWVEGSLKRKAEIINGDASGRLQGTKAMYLDYVGTFYNYSGDLRRAKDCTDAEWEEIFIILSNPINNHTISVPFGSVNMSNEFYISSAESKVIKAKETTDEYYSTHDKAVVPGRSYYVLQSGSYVLVNSPTTANIASYYEKAKVAVGYKWENVYSVTFTSMAPQRLASSPATIAGVSNG